MRNRLLFIFIITGITLIVGDLCADKKEAQYPNAINKLIINDSKTDGSPRTVQADNLYSSIENWSFYTDSCGQLDSAMFKVNEQMRKNSDTIFSNNIKFHLDRMNSVIKTVKDKDIDQNVYLSCQAKAVEAEKLLNITAIYEAKIEQRLDNEARKGHESSLFYNKAKELGFEDYSWLGSIRYDYKEKGKDEIKKWIFLVDNDCGRFFRAIKYIEPYVIYSAMPARNNMCGKEELIAVAPPDGFTVKKGQYIDKASYYVFSGFLPGARID